MYFIYATALHASNMYVPINLIKDSIDLFDNLNEIK